MFVEMTPSSGGSGSNIVYGTEPDKSTASAEFTINTGLSSISRFIIWGLSGNGTSVIIYDKDAIGSNKFSSANIQQGAVAQKPSGTIGDNPGQYYSSLKALSGGNVTIKQATNASNIFKTNIQWYAES